jgi:SAM-dependent methyltransferase
MVEKDLFGQALYDYWTNNQPEDMITWTHLTEPEILPTAYLFRTYEKMPESEQIALQQAKGKVLDVGAGSGTHSLFLQNKGKDVTALERSPVSCRLMQDRGVKNIVEEDFFKYQTTQKYDTLLFLMNGVGIVQKARYLNRLFIKIDELLSPEGQALIHSSDLKYLYQTETGYLMPKNDYYGDVKFFVSYKNRVESFEWTYIDENTLRIFARQNGFKVEKIYESKMDDFLLKLNKRR